MNLQLETISPEGTLTEDLMPQIVRQLTREDMKITQLPNRLPKGMSKPSPLKRLSERHRNLARIVASGLPLWEVSAISGYSTERISVLKGDPAFKNLVLFYAEAKDQLFETMYEKLAGMSSEASDLLRDRMEEFPDEIENSTLLDIVKIGADRSGHGPQSTNVNVNVNIADRLNAARKRIASAKQIEGTVVETPQPEGKAQVPTSQDAA